MSEKTNILLNGISAASGSCAPFALSPVPLLREIAGAKYIRANLPAQYDLVLDY